MGSMTQKINIETLFKITVSTLTGDCKGDFYDESIEDEASEEFYFAVCTGGAPLALYNEQVGTKVIDSGLFCDAIEQLKAGEEKHRYPWRILAPVLNAAYVGSRKPLADAFEKSEFGFYVASPDESTENYRSTILDLRTIFTITAVADCSDVYFDSAFRQLYVNEGVCENLAWAFSELVENQAWVMVLRPMACQAPDNGNLYLFNPRAVRRAP